MTDETKKPLLSFEEFASLPLEEMYSLLREERQDLQNASYTIAQLRQQIYGRKSEKLKAIIDQPALPGLEYIFDETSDVDESDPENDPQEEKEQKTEKQKKKPGRKPLPEHLPRERIIHDLNESDKTCACGQALHKIGEETSEQIEYIPAKVKVIQHVRYKYACKCCEDTVKTAPTPAQPIPRSIATPSLLAQVFVSKFDDHLPLYRQSEIWKRIGVDLNRATLSNWVVKAGRLYPS